MILSFKHKGLELFYTTGSTRGIQANHANKLRLILGRLDDAQILSDMDFHGACLHPLKGDLKDHYSIKINGNWRVAFKFKNGHVEVVDYQDYH